MDPEDMTWRDSLTNDSHCGFEAQMVEQWTGNYKVWTAEYLIVVRMYIVQVII